MEIDRLPSYMRKKFKLGEFGDPLKDAVMFARMNCDMPSRKMTYGVNDHAPIENKSAEAKLGNRQVKIARSQEEYYPQADRSTIEWNENGMDFKIEITESPQLQPRQRAKLTARKEGQRVGECDLATMSRNGIFENDQVVEKVLNPLVKDLNIARAEQSKERISVLVESFDSAVSSFDNEPNQLDQKPDLSQ